ncbi:MAG: amidohydrolase family protein [Dehalococcoidia bacterium]
MLWDVHCHFPRNWENPDDPQHERAVDSRADALRAAGVTRASLLCGGRFGISYDESIVMARRHEDLFLPSAQIDPEDISSGELRRLHELGFRGLKISGVRRPYDHYKYFPLYQTAEELGMPILFHLGVLGGGIDYSITHPRRDPQAAQSIRRQREMAEQAQSGAASGRAAFRRGGMRDISATRMKPFHLDTIANSFPALKMIGAHMGGTGNYDEASSVARWRHNVFFDLSGGDTIERHAVERRLVGYEIGVEKLTWGSDCGNDDIAPHIERLEWIFEQSNLTEDESDRIRYWNAAEIFGESEPVLAAE